MKNLLSTLNRMLRTRTWRAVGGRASRPPRRKPEQPDPCAPASWQMLATLLETQARVHALNAVEPVYSRTSVRAEALDIALRETIRAQSLALVRLQEEGMISEELLEELLLHGATAPTQAGSPPVSGNARFQIKGAGK